MSIKRKRKNLPIISRHKGSQPAVLNGQGEVVAAETNIAFSNRQGRLRRNLRLALKQTALDVQAENYQAGVAVTSLENGQIVKVYPDGRREILKAEVAPPVRITQVRFSLG